MIRVAYIVDEWITLSQTFIRKEVSELRRQGVHVEVVALGRGDVEGGADEPATYLPGIASARLEWMFLVTETGNEVLTDFEHRIS